MRDIPPPNDAEDHDPTKLERSVIEHEESIKDQSEVTMSK